jgi:protein TonB
MRIRNCRFLNNIARYYKTKRITKNHFMKTIFSLLIFFSFIASGTAQVIAPPPPPPEPVERQEGADGVFVVVEEMPRFPGCEAIEGSDHEKKTCADGKLMEFIVRNIKYPQEARKAGIEGRCILSFIVGKDGMVSDIKLLRDIGGGCGAESLRVLELINTQELRWKPGVQRGKEVKVKYTIPVQFKL